jgi:hypothetical protein
VIRFLVTVILGTAAVPQVAVAQTAPSTTPDSLRASIIGTVRDSLGSRVVGAGILLLPSGLIYQTDTAGRFTARNVPVGSLTIGVRKPGFSPLQSQVNVPVGADLVLDLVMQRLPRMLAEVEVKAERQCPRFRFEGILCRQESASGYYMNRQDILDKATEVSFTRLLLRDAPGFRQNLNGNPTTVESTVGWRCIAWIYDGGFPYSVPLRVKPTDIFAIEVYQPPDIPLEYQQHYWRGPAPCTLVVMWTVREAQKGLKRLSTSK